MGVSREQRLSVESLPIRVRLGSATLGSRHHWSLYIGASGVGNYSKTVMGIGQPSWARRLAPAHIQNSRVTWKIIVIIIVMIASQSPFHVTLLHTQTHTAPHISLKNWKEKQLIKENRKDKRQKTKAKKGQTNSRPQTPWYKPSTLNEQHPKLNISICVEAISVRFLWVKISGIFHIVTCP